MTRQPTDDQTTGANGRAEAHLSPEPQKPPQDMNIGGEGIETIRKIVREAMIQYAACYAMSFTRRVAEKKQIADEATFQILAALSPYREGK